MSIITRRNLFLWLVAICEIACGAQHLVMGDPSRTSIATTIAHTSLASSSNIDLIYQADAAGLSSTAYNEYTKIWLGQQQNVNANLWRGFAAQRYWASADRPNSTVHLSEEYLQTIYQAAENCLHFARDRAPTSALTNLYYGNFLFWYGSNETKGEHMTEGLTFMKKALAIAPHNPQVHTLLGAAYSEKSGNAYNLVLAEKELRLAEKGNPANSYIPWRLTSVYISLGQFIAAQRELSRCQKMVPANLATPYYFSYYQSEISKHLSNEIKN